MKFIVDAQLPIALSDFLNQKGFDSIHTLNMPEGNTGLTPKEFLKDEKMALSSLFYQKN